MLAPSNDGADHATESPRRLKLPQGDPRLPPPHQPTPLDDKIWWEMCRLYPKFTAETPS